jgi:hypothetical protein
MTRAIQKHGEILEDNMKKIQTGTELSDYMIHLRSRVGADRAHAIICNFIEKHNSECEFELISNMPISFEKNSLVRFLTIISKKEYNRNAIIFVKKLNLFFDLFEFQKSISLFESNKEFFIKDKKFVKEIYLNVIFACFSKNETSYAKKYARELFELESTFGDIDCPPQIDLPSYFRKNGLDKETVEACGKFVNHWLSVSLEAPRK